MKNSTNKGFVVPLVIALVIVLVGVGIYFSRHNKSSDLSSIIPNSSNNPNTTTNPNPSTSPNTTTNPNPSTSPNQSTTPPGTVPDRLPADPSSPSISAPKGGETLKIGSTYTIRIYRKGLSGPATLTLAWPKTSCATGVPCATAPAAYTIISGITTDSYTWIVGHVHNANGQSVVADPHEYTIRVCINKAAGGVLCSSDTDPKVLIN